MFISFVFWCMIMVTASLWYFIIGLRDESSKDRGNQCNRIIIKPNSHPNRSSKPYSGSSGQIFYFVIIDKDESSSEKSDTWYNLGSNPRSRCRVNIFWQESKEHRSDDDKGEGGDTRIFSSGCSFLSDDISSDNTDEYFDDKFYFYAIVQQWEIITDMIHKKRSDNKILTFLTVLPVQIEFFDFLASSRSLTEKFERRIETRIVIETVDRDDLSEFCSSKSLVQFEDDFM